MAKYHIEGGDWHIEVYTNHGVGQIAVLGLDDNEPNGHDRFALGEYRAAFNALTSIILAHACAGINVETKAYAEGVKTTVDAILNEYGE